MAASPVRSEGEPTRRQRQPASPPGDETNAAEAATDKAELESLVHRLVSRVRAKGKRAHSGTDRPVVLLDIELDGVRCLMLETADAGTMATLSPREQEIVRMVAWGYPNKTIAAVLEISSWTVATYVRRIFNKLGVNSRTAMVTCVIEEGLVPDLIAPERSLDRSWSRSLGQDLDAADPGTGGECRGPRGAR